MTAKTAFINDWSKVLFKNSVLIDVSQSTIKHFQEFFSKPLGIVSLWKGNPNYGSAGFIGMHLCRRLLKRWAYSFRN